MSQASPTLVRIPLPDGEWVDIRDPTRVTRGDRKKFLRFGKAAAAAVADAGGDMSKVDADVALDSGMDSLDGLVILWVAAWSLTRKDDAGSAVPWPIPADAPDLLDDLDLDISNAIETALEPVMDKLSGRTVKAADPDPASPSVPSPA